MWKRPVDAPSPTNSFDLVFSHGALHHIPDVITSAKGNCQDPEEPGGHLNRNALNYARRLS